MDEADGVPREGRTTQVECAWAMGSPPEVRRFLVDSVAIDATDNQYRSMTKRRESFSVCNDVRVNTSPALSGPENFPIGGYTVISPLDTSGATA